MRRAKDDRLSCSTTSALLALIVACGVTLAPTTRAAQPRFLLPTVLARATHYVDELHRQLAGVVMEERYAQHARIPPLHGRMMSRHRVTLLSDYLLVQPEGSERHFGFRDVFAVNGRTVRDRQERLTELFLNRSASVDRRIRSIVTDSARHNIGDIERNINTPTMALLFLTSAYRSRVEFRRGTDTATSLGMDEPWRGSSPWVVEYEERGPTTVIRGRDDRPLPVQGRYWIDAATGRVLLSELVLDADSIAAVAIVRYDANETLGHAVPVEMRERYRNLLSGSFVEGTSTYSRFRRFQVLVDESTSLPN